MDCVKAASELRQLLIIVDEAQHTISALDCQIATLSRRHLQSALDGNMTESLRLALRLSTSEGVRYMYKAYVDKKMNQIQQKARSIASTLRGDVQNEESSHDTRQVQTVKMDKTTTVWSTNFCELHRSS